MTTRKRGRPRIYCDNAVQSTVNNETYAALKAAADKAGVSVFIMLRKVLEEWAR